MSKLFFDIFDIPYIRLVASKTKLAVHPDYIDRINKLPTDSQYNKLLEFTESLLLVEESAFPNLEEEVKRRLREQEHDSGGTYSSKIYEMIPKAIRELKKRHPEKVEVVKSEEEKKLEQEQIKEFYENVKSKEGIPDLSWPEQFKKMITEKESCKLPSKYRQILNNRR